MSLSTYTITVLPTARPWLFDAIGASAGAATTEVGYNVNKTDGSGAGGSSGLNNVFAYGQQHGAVGETAPHTVAVSPGNLVHISYTSGTAKKDSGGTLYSPMGETSGTTGLSPTIDYTDSSGYVYPTDCMPAAGNLSRLAPTSGRVAIVGCFTDSGGAIISNSLFDWRSMCRVFTLSSAGNASGGNTQYVGSFPNGLSNALVGKIFTVLGFSTAANNGTFTCTASTTSILTLNNASGVSQSQAATATVNDFQVIVPAGAAFLSLGVNDTILFDNGGAGFTLAVSVLSTTGYTGDSNFFNHVPLGLVCSGSLADNLRTNVFLTSVLYPLFDISTNGFMSSYIGQLYPRDGRMQPSAVGQVYPF